MPFLILDVDICVFELAILPLKYSWFMWHNMFILPPKPFWSSRTKQNTKVKAEVGRFTQEVKGSDPNQVLGVNASCVL